MILRGKECKSLVASQATKNSLVTLVLLVLVRANLLLALVVSALTGMQSLTSRFATILYKACNQTGRLITCAESMSPSRKEFAQTGPTYSAIAKRERSRLSRPFGRKCQLTPRALTNLTLLFEVQMREPGEGETARGCENSESSTRFLHNNAISVLDQAAPANNTRDSESAQNQQTETDSASERERGRRRRRRRRGERLPSPSLRARERESERARDAD